MTVLVTGGAGYIGSHMVHHFGDVGERVVVLDDMSTGVRSAIPADVPLIIGSAGDRELVVKVLREYGIDAIIHFAGSIVVPESLRDPLGYYRNNTVNTFNLLEAATAVGLKYFIFSSTAAVYGNADRESPAEDDPTHPISPYGRSKLMSEMMLSDVAKATGLHWVALRYFNVAGADPKGRTGQSAPGATHLMKVSCEAALGKRTKVEIFGDDYATPDGTGIRDYIHVSDLVKAHADALRYLRSGGISVTLNCGYGRGASVKEVISAVKRVSRADFQVVVGRRRTGDPAILIADSSRLRRVLPWSPQYQDLDTIVAHSLQWECSLPVQLEAPISKGSTF